ncbi:protein YAE1 homolog [Liolophura sinensis]|uniref:protein YAE1 homolog n=1 Tax=Liolophura sinensis TaxID=3198878 RepID=UPI003158EE52
MATCTDYDDTFDDDVDDERRLSLEENEWLRNREARVKEGYVDGLTEGQDLFLQQGFNEGYRQAAQLAAAIARIKGSVCALLSFHLAKNGTLLSREAEEDFQALLTHISEVQGQYLSESCITSNQGLDSKMADIVSLSKRLGLVDTRKRESGSKNKSVSGENTNAGNAAGNMYTVTDESHSTNDKEKFSVHASREGTNNDDGLSDLKDGGERETTRIGKPSCDFKSNSLDRIQQELERLVSLHQVPRLI